MNVYGQGEDKLLQQELPKHRLFLVLDNVQTSGTSVASVDSFLKFKSFKAGSVVLITSSCSHETLLRTFHDIAWTEVFPVPTLQKEEAACLLAKSAGYDLSKLSDKENMYVSKFVERCYLGFKKDDRQYHPRALETLGSYIRRRGRTEWVNWYGICQRGEKEVFCELLGRFNELLGQVFTSSNPTMYFDIILTLPRGDTRVSSRILHTQEDFCEWYAFAFPDATGIPASVGFVVRLPNFDQVKCLMLLINTYDDFDCKLETCRIFSKSTYVLQSGFLKCGMLWW